MADTLRVAAIGDLHIGAADSGRSYARMFRELSSAADVLLLCGDLTHHGTVAEAERLVSDLQACSIPVMGLFGNHDYESDETMDMDRILRTGGMRPLGAHIQDIRGVGFAGVKGFGGGFGRHVLSPFGEPVIKHFVEEAVRESLVLENALRQLSNLERVVVALHYAPITGTLQGEPTELLPYLGTSRLEDTIDRFDNVKAVFHGHSHHGTYKGATARGIPVYNVAESIPKDTDRPYAIVEV